MLNIFQPLHRLPVASLKRRRGIHFSRMSANPVPIRPKFITTEVRDLHSQSEIDGISATAVYIKSSLFPHSPSPCLRWKNRSDAVLTVVKNLSADFLCLQELDNDNFYEGNTRLMAILAYIFREAGRSVMDVESFISTTEFLVEDRIVYNDFVNSIQDGSAYGDEQSIMMAEGNNDADSKNVSLSWYAGSLLL